MKNITRWATMCVWLFLCPSAHATVWYVNRAATGGNNGTGWTNAFVELQSALSVARVSDQIWVARGTYLPDFDAATGHHSGDRKKAFNIPGGVTLYGGFGGGETQLSARNWENNPTVLSGAIGVKGSKAGNAYKVIYINARGAVFRVDGFVICNGKADGPALGAPDDYKGNGGGVLALRASEIAFVNCRFYGNYASYGGAICVEAEGSRLYLFNCVFAGNEARWVGGAMETRYNATIEHCTFYSNRASRASAVGQNWSAYVVEFHNNIVWGNSNTSAVELGNGHASHNIVQTVLPGTNNIVADPMVSRVPSSGPDGLWAAGDDVLGTLRLKSGSPAIGLASGTLVSDMTNTDENGVNAEPLLFDLEKKPRVPGRATCAGALEFVNSAPTDIQLSCDAITENLPAGTLVGRFSTIDPDFGTFTYALVDGKGCDDNSRFLIDGDGLFSVAEFDFDARQLCSIRVRSTDEGGLFVEKPIAVHIHKAPAPPFGVSVKGKGSVTVTSETSLHLAGNVAQMKPVPDPWYRFTQWSDGNTNTPRIIVINTHSNSYEAQFEAVTAVETLSFNGKSRTAPIGMPALFIDRPFEGKTEMARLTSSMYPVGMSSSFIDRMFVVETGVVQLASATLHLTTTFPRGAIYYSLNGEAPSYDSMLYTGAVTLATSAVIRARAYSADFATTWEMPPVLLTVTPVSHITAESPGGGHVSFQPEKGPYTVGTVVTFTAVPDPGWTFQTWEGTVVGNNNTTSIVVRGDVVVRAIFGTKIEGLAVGSGYIVLDPQQALYPFHSSVTVTAQPLSGYKFAAWGGALAGKESPTRLTVDQTNLQVTALFVREGTKP